MSIPNNKSNTEILNEVHINAFLNTLFGNIDNEELKNHIKLKMQTIPVEQLESFFGIIQNVHNLYSKM